MISTVAGTDRVRDNGPATGSLLRLPIAVTTDKAGNIYIADQQDGRVRKVAPNGTITTFAGGGGSTADNVLATSAALDEPSGLAFDALGNLFIADYQNNKVRKVTPAGLISTVAGNGRSTYSGDNGPATSAGTDAASVAVDAAGNIYIADASNFRIRKVTPSGTITTYAGTGSKGSGGDGGPATGAQIGEADDLAVDAAGNLYFIDVLTSTTAATKRVVRKITPSGTISTVAGNGTSTFTGDQGLATAAGIDPQGLAVDAAGNLYISDAKNARIRKVTASTGVITTIAGTGKVGYFGDGGPALNAQFGLPQGLWVDAQGSLYVADVWNNRVRKIDVSGTITTIAGSDVKDGGPATSAFLNRPTSVAYDPAQGLYIGDGFNHRLRRVGSTGNISTAAGTGYEVITRGDVAGNQTDVGFPGGMAFDATGNLYFAEGDFGVIYKLTPSNVISFFSGNGSRIASGIPASSLFLFSPAGVATDKTGNIYFSDPYIGYVWKTNTAGVATVIAGNGTQTASGDGGASTSAGVDAEDLAADAAGNLFIADSNNNRIRKISAAGIITTVAGTGTAGFGGDGGPASSAQLNFPTGVAVDAQGNLFISDFFNARVRRVDAQTGVITTIAGNGSGFFSGDNVAALQSSLTPYRTAVAPDGSLYVADALNDRIRKLTPVVAAKLAVASGNNQTAAVGTQVASPLVISVTTANGTPAPGVPVTFAVTSGSATLSPATAVTGTDGTANTIVTLGTTAGPVVVTATAAGLPPVTFTITATPPISATAPTINAGGVVGAGLSTPSVSAISANGIATVFGTNFTTAGVNRTVATGDLVNGQLPTNLAGVCVLVGGQRAPIFGVYGGTPNQINFQVPGVTQGPVDVQVITGCGTVDEVRSAALSVTARTAAPEFFYFRSSADGKNPIAATNAVTYALIGNPDVLGAGFTPAKPGDYISLYGTGFGPTTPAIAPGQLPPGVSSLAGAVSVTIGGVPVTGADLLYVGISPGYAGLYTIALRIPDSVPDGDQPVVINVGGAPSPAGAFVTVRR